MMSNSRPSHVFLSYSEANEAFVEALARRLKDDARLSFWFRPWHAIPGQDLQAQMEQALSEAQACAVFLGTVRLEDLEDEQMRGMIQALGEQAPGETRLDVRYVDSSAISGQQDELMHDAILRHLRETPDKTQSYHFTVDLGELRGWQNEQMRAAIQARVEDDPTYRVIPVLLPGTARPNRRNLPRFLRLYEPVEFRSPDDQQAFRYLLAGILGIPPIDVEGFLEARADAAPAEIIETTIEDTQPSPPAPGFEPLHVDPEDPPFRAIRDLLLAAFTPKKLYQFCHDRSDFRPLLTGVGAGLVLDDMVTAVISYCEKKLLWDELLAEVAREAPRQYARFEPQLRGEDLQT
jgi:hypothetical protein